MLIPDLLILGAGPAGFALSHLMIHRGYSVEMVDSAYFPRAKICGEFLNPQAVRWITSQGLLPELLQLSPHPIHGMKVSNSSGRSFTGHYVSGGQQNGFSVMRKDFDTLLVKKAKEAGTPIQEGFRASRIVFENGRAVGIQGVDTEGRLCEKRGRVLVGADGRNNLIGRTFGWMKAIPDLRKYAFLTYFENIPEASDFGEIHLVDKGYVGIAPLNQSLANVILVIDEAQHPGSSMDQTDFLLKYLRNSHLKQRFQGLVPITPVVSSGPIGFQVARKSGAGVILVGDSCGFIDPFTGEGINYAFLSAGLAAGVLEGALRDDDLSAERLSVYDRERKALLDRKFHLVKMLQRAIPHPYLSRWIVDRFARDAELGDRIVSAVGSAIPLEEIWNFRFLLKVVAGW